jgi:hypothetical protein
MSQQKVDKYKEEKKNRKKTLKLQKVKKALAVLIVSLGIGAIIGIPLGKVIYKYQKAEAEKHKTIEATAYGQWFDEMWADSYAHLGSNSDAELQKLLEDYYNSSSTDASATDAE